MIKNKKFLTSILVIFLLLFTIVGCTSKNDEEVEKDNPVVDNSGDKNEDETENEDEDEEDTDEITDATTLMIENSDYISKVKLITKGNANSEIKVLENIKDVISASELPALELEENRAYLVFLKNDGDNVVLVDGENSVVLLEGDNHELFEKINKHVHR